MMLAASEYLCKHAALPRLHESMALSKAARNAQCENGALSLIQPVSLDSHMNKLGNYFVFYNCWLRLNDSNTAWDSHIKKYGTYGKFVSENCSYGYTDPMMMLAQILQEGKETVYGARRNLLQKHWIVGFAVGDHKSMGTSWVIIITDRFDEKVGI